MNYKEILRKAVDDGNISVGEYNDGIYGYLTYRIVWEQENHLILFMFPTEEEAIKYVNGREGYYYSRIQL